MLPLKALLMWRSLQPTLWQPLTLMPLILDAKPCAPAWASFAWGASKACADCAVLCALPPPHLPPAPKTPASLPQRSQQQQHQPSRWLAWRPLAEDQWPLPARRPTGQQSQQAGRRAAGQLPGGRLRGQAGPRRLAAGWQALPCPQAPRSLRHPAGQAPPAVAAAGHGRLRARPTGRGPTFVE